MIWRNVFWVVVAVVVAGCGGEVMSGGQDRVHDEVVVLAKADGWRDGLQEAAGHSYALVEIATDEASAQRAWDENVPASLPDAGGDPALPGRYATLASVDLDRQAVVVFSSGQSGSCPAWVTSVDAVDGRLEVELTSTADQGEPCTDDFQPYRLVLAIDRGRLPDLDRLPVERIDLPSENLTDVEGRATTYPADEAPDPPANAGEGAAAGQDGIGEPVGLDVERTDRIQIRDVPRDPWPPWTPAERAAAGLEQGELIGELTDAEAVAAIVEALDDAHRIDLGDLAYDLAPPDREVVLLEGDEVLERVGYYDQLGPWGEHRIEGRWLHGWDPLTLTVALLEQLTGE